MLYRSNPACVLRPLMSRTTCLERPLPWWIRRSGVPEFVEDNVQPALHAECCTEAPNRAGGRCAARSIQSAVKVAVQTG